MGAPVVVMQNKMRSDHVHIGTGAMKIGTKRPEKSELLRIWVWRELDTRDKKRP